MKLSKILPLAFSFTSSLLVNGQSFCSNTKHSGQSVTVNNNRVGSIGSVGYELWFEGGYNSATFYSDGSFSCSFQNSKDYLCRTGLSFDSSKSHSQIGHMYADFKLVKQNIRNVDYSYVGIYGWTRNPLVEWYIVDNWLSQYRPGDWVGNRKHGDFTIDGAQYTVYENTRYGPSIDGNTSFKQYFSIRKQARDCGTIDITAHFQQWEKLGMTMGRMHEAKILGEAGSNGGGTTGTADFPYAKVYIGNQKAATTTRKTTIKRTTTRKTTAKTTVKKTTTRKTTQSTSSNNKCSSKITKQGYKCCSKNCVVYYIDNDGNWGYENNNWCGCSNTPRSCRGVYGYPCCKTNKKVYYTDQSGKWSVENADWCLI